MRKLYFSGTWGSNKLFDGARNKSEKKKQTPNLKPPSKKEDS